MSRDDDERRDESGGAAYLWDRSGPVDPEVARLELALSAYRLPDAARARPRRLVALWPLAAAAALVVALGAGAFLAGGRSPGAGAPGWDLAALEGAPALGDGVLRPGQALVTGDGERVRVQVADIGRLDLQPGSTLRLVRTAANEHRVALDRGRLDAFVIAPPRLFLVETPAALAVDLGCAYELHVADDGSGRLRVTSGWVALERDGRETIVPEGAVCRLDPARGPGVPRYEASPERFDRALDAVEAGDHSAAAVDALIGEAAAHDALSLWHLIPRVRDVAVRRTLAEAVARNDPPPADVSLDAVVRLEPDALRLWRDELALGW